MKVEMKSALVLTTINIPTLLYDFAEDAKQNERENETLFIVVGDNKTPNIECNKISKKIEKKYGVKTIYLDVISQKKWLKNYPELDNIIPYNSDNRRNIGYLKAYELGVNNIVLIDDDNYKFTNDFFGEHNIVGNNIKCNVVESNNGWFNTCDMLNSKPIKRIYPRGHPYSKRWNETISHTYDERRIVLNLGLWIGDPDIDAVTRLNEPIKMTGLKDDYQKIILEKDTYCSINTQNTSFLCEILPCFYYVVMGYDFGGLKIDRYGDIWAGYFAKKIIDHMGGFVSIGTPLTNHKRNIHDLFKDLKEELYGMIYTEKIIDYLENIKLYSNNYSDSYIELSEEIASLGDNKYASKYFSHLSRCMKIWVETIEKI